MSAVHHPGKKRVPISYCLLEDFTLICGSCQVFCQFWKIAQINLFVLNSKFCAETGNLILVQEYRMHEVSTAGVPCGGKRAERAVGGEERVSYFTVVHLKIFSWWDGGGVLLPLERVCVV